MFGMAESHLSNLSYVIDLPRQEAAIPRELNPHEGLVRNEAYLLMDLGGRLRTNLDYFQIEISPRRFRVERFAIQALWAPSGCSVYVSAKAGNKLGLWREGSA